jgi:hypothetical protein
MASNSKPRIGRDVISNVIQFFDEEEFGWESEIPNLKCNVTYCSSCRKSQATVYKTREEVNVASSGGEKLRSPGRKRKCSSKRIRHDDFDV